MAYAIGIDVGTTFTAAAVWEAGRASVLPLGRRSDSVPTVLYLDKDGKWLIGDAAERRAIVDPQHIARAFKRRMGDDVPIRIGDRNITAQELTGTIIRWVVARSVERYGSMPDQAVLTHPAEWGEFRTDRMRAAAADAGLASIALVSEPIAAASYYAVRVKMPPGSLIGVYDLGGGTFDAGLARKTVSGFELFGRPVGDETGGIDIDQEVVEHVRRSFGDHWLALDPGDPDTLAGLAALRDQIVLAKEGLSDDLEVVIPVMLPGFARQVRLTRIELEDLADEFIERTVVKFGSLLAAAGVGSRDLAAVLLVGGGSRMPMVAERLTASLHLRVTVDAHPKYAVCLGAATLAAVGLTSETEIPDGKADHVDHNVATVAASVDRILANDRPAESKFSLAQENASTASSSAPRKRPHTEPSAESGRTSVSMIADLVLAGLTDPVDGGRRETTARHMTSPGTSRGEPLIIRTRQARSRQSEPEPHPGELVAPKKNRRRRAVAVTIAGIGLLVILTLFLALHR